MSSIKALSLVVLASLVSACGLLGGPGPIERSLSSASVGQSVDTSGWCAGSWQYVLVVPPYWDQDSVNEALGFAWPGYKGTGQDMRDDVNLFICVSSGTVTSSESVPRQTAFLPTNDILTIKRDASSVSVKEDGGRRYLEVTERP